MSIRTIPKTFEKARAVFRKWLYLPNTTNLEFVWAVCAANRLDGTPVWGGLVGPPGAGKTALIQSLDDADPVTGAENRFILRSSLTEHTLISGLQAKDAAGGAEPSLLPKLDGKILIIKDFSSIISKRAEIRTAIFGQLRDCFDGSAQSSYGTGESKRFKAKFGLLLAVTIDIEDTWAKEQSLGERILYCREDLTESQYDTMTEEACRHVEQNSERTEALRRASFSVTALPSTSGLVPPEPEFQKVMAMATFVAAARTQIKRVGPHGEFQRAPHNEVGTRLAQQYLLLGKGWCSMREQWVWKPACTEFLQKVAPGSIPSNRWKLLRILWGPDSQASGGLVAGRLLSRTYTTDRLSVRSGLSLHTVTRTCQELEGVGLVTHSRIGNALAWTFSKRGTSLVERAGLQKSLGVPV